MCGNTSSLFYKKRHSSRVLLAMAIATTHPLTLSQFAATLARLENLSAAAKRTILTNLANGTVALEDCWPANEFTRLAALKGYNRAQTASTVWAEAQQRIEPRRLWETLQHLGVTVVVWGSSTGTKEYPRLLNEIHNPPAVLFVRGNPQVLTGKTLAIVGTRKISEYGHDVVKHVVGGFQAVTPGKVTIVSGLAAGVDGAAHRAALVNGLPTVAVFGCGIDTVFPASHSALAREILEANGALVSEYPPGFPGSQYSFPQRNRIIAGLSYGTLVVEGALKSGSLITARLALEENRSVFAVPGNVFNPVSDGPHQLLRDGAVLTTCAEDIVTELGWVKVPEQTTQPSLLSSSDVAETGEEHPLLAHIGYDATPIEVVAQRSGLAMTDLQPELLMLELSGAITSCPGAAVARR